MSSQTAPGAGLVVGVLGASGGVGTSTLTTGLAVTAARGTCSPFRGPAVAVDGLLAGGGLDVTACVEHLPGLRWPDLAGSRGEVAGADLLAELPRAGGARLLSAAAEGPLPPPQVVASVMRSLRSVAGVVVVDLPGAASPAGVEALEAACDVVLLLTGTTPRQLADAVAACKRVGAVFPDAPVGLVVRGSVRTESLASTMAEHLGLPLAACWRDDGRVAVDAERGRTPGDRQRSSLAAVCDDLLAWVAADRRAA
jgi:hypothetical protein